MLRAFSLILLSGSITCGRYPTSRQFRALQNKVTTLTRSLQDLQFEINDIKNDHKRELTKIRYEVKDLQDASYEDSDLIDLDDSSGEYNSSESGSSKDRSEKYVSLQKFEELEKRINNTNFSNFITLDDVNVLVETQNIKEEKENVMKSSFRQYFAAMACYIGDSYLQKMRTFILDQYRILKLCEKIFDFEQRI